MIGQWDRPPGLSLCYGTRVLWVFALVSAACAQEAAVERGSQLFRVHCATPYCHGPAGTVGRAPKLIGHNASLNSMFKIISWGIPGTGMPEFTSRLKTEELADLVAYVMTLRGAPGAPSGPPAPRAPSRVPTPDAREGRALFFDAGRTGACGACHELDGWGVPVGPDLTASPPERYDSLRRVPRNRVGTARPTGGLPFPALLVEQSESRVRVYDLTAALPVLRTFAPHRLTWDPKGDPNTAWRHEEATRIYTDRELETISRYLRWLAPGPTGR
jgi:mono/diheme cytochrome c family protein